MSKSPETISDKLIQSVADSLRRNEHTRYKLSDGGRIHIDRQLPFLSLYRRPSTHDDIGTERLLLGEPAYILADDKPENQQQLGTLIEKIIEIQHDLFGASLVLELWSGPEVSDETEPVVFRIVAPDDIISNEFLESLENALLNIRVNNQGAKVAITYDKGELIQRSPPLLTQQVLKQFNCLYIGIEVSPIYRNAIQNTLYSFRLRQLNRELTRSLKRGFYTFVQSCTSMKPAHFLALGRHAMTRAVFEADEKLAKISNNFDILLHVTPTNVSTAWHEFQRSNYERHPAFLYRPRHIDPDLVKRELFAISLEYIEDPTLAIIFSKKREELDRQVTMIADRNTPRFILGSRQLFGDISAELLKLAHQILNIKGNADSNRDGDNFVLSTELAGLAQQEIEYYRKQDPALSAKVEIRQDVSGILVSKGNFLIGTDVKVPRDRINATLAHEIGTHILTHYNGSQQPFRELYAGMVNYESMQEGLAVLSEYLTGEVNLSRFHLLASRVIAVQMMTEGADFIETFRQLQKDYNFSASTAFNITMRVFRGGGYTKDMVYLKGLTQILDYLTTSGDLEQLYIGKISYEYLSLIDELQWRQVIVPPRLRPRYMDNPDALKRLERLRQGLTVLDLIKETV